MGRPDSFPQPPPPLSFLVEIGTPILKRPKRNPTPKLPSHCPHGPFPSGPIDPHCPLPQPSQLPSQVPSALSRASCLTAPSSRLLSLKALSSQFCPQAHSPLTAWSPHGHIPSQTYPQTSSLLVLSSPARFSNSPVP